jgi:hypothetical protein
LIYSGKYAYSKKILHNLYTPFNLIVGQVQTITGYVIDGRTNQPIIGANILVVGTESGSSSDEDGKFSIKWSGVFPIKVKITHIAYEALEQSINNSGTYSFR